MLNSYKGKILISTPDISGDIFSRSVILIVEHNQNGAFGFILNKSNDDLRLSLAKTSGLDIQIYEGGPVENDKIFFIVKGKTLVEDFIEINNEYYITQNTEKIITALIEEQISLFEIKVFSGYSGWVSGQLEEEIKNKYWQVIDIYNIDFVAPSNHQLWKNIMQNLGGEFLIWANTPKDISYN